MNNNTMTKEMMEMYLEARRNGVSHKEAMELLNPPKSGKGKAKAEEATTVTYAVVAYEKSVRHVFTFDGKPSDECKKLLRYNLFNYNGKDCNWFGFVGTIHDDKVDEILACYGKKKSDFVK